MMFLYSLIFLDQGLLERRDNNDHKERDDKKNQK